MPLNRSRLILETGDVFSGILFGKKNNTQGEVVFNTSHTGYQEILTDPSYAGQIVVMTYPLIGNYGTVPMDIESRSLWIKGLITKEVATFYSNYAAKYSLDQYLLNEGITALSGIDTRRLVRIIRKKGAVRGMITTSTEPIQNLVKKIKVFPKIEDRNLVETVTTSKPYEIKSEVSINKTLTVLAIDYGIKHSILNYIKKNNCNIHVVPASITIEEILSYSPHGILLSNGPGDPSNVDNAIDTIKNLHKLFSKKSSRAYIPIFGICLGAQIIALALGAKTYKLKFGHHGSNHPVKDLETGHIAITSQNHNFAIDGKTLPQKLMITHKNLYDHTIEGIRHKTFPIYGVQYHPEAAPGPRDSTFLFNKFIRDMKKTTQPK